MFQCAMVIQRNGMQNEKGTQNKNRAHEFKIISLLVGWLFLAHLFYVQGLQCAMGKLMRLTAFAFLLNSERT